MPIREITGITEQSHGLHARLLLETAGRALEMDLPRSKASRLQRAVRELMPSSPQSER